MPIIPILREILLSILPVFTEPSGPTNAHNRTGAQDSVGRLCEPAAVPAFVRQGLSASTQGTRLRNRSELSRKVMGGFGGRCAA